MSKIKSVDINFYKDLRKKKFLIKDEKLLNHVLWD